MTTPGGDRAPPYMLKAATFASSTCDSSSRGRRNHYGEPATTPVGGNKRPQVCPPPFLVGGSGWERFCMVKSSLHNSIQERCSGDVTIVRSTPFPRMRAACLRAPGRRANGGM
jgi:hypothetical protein